MVVGDGEGRSVAGGSGGGAVGVDFCDCRV